MMRRHAHLLNIVFACANNPRVRVGGMRECMAWFECYKAFSKLEISLVRKSLKAAIRFDRRRSLG